jgi:hypothetical protein
MAVWSLMYIKNTFVLSYPEKRTRARICKRLRRPGIDSEDSIPPAYVAWRACTTNRVVVQARQAVNRFLGSFEGLQIRYELRGKIGMLIWIRINVMGRYSPDSYKKAGSAHGSPLK